MPRFKVKGATSDITIVLLVRQPQCHFTPTSSKLHVVNESGVDESVTSKFPGSEVKVGSAASGAGDNREIPVEEGGDINRITGQ